MSHSGEDGSGPGDPGAPERNDPVRLRAINDRAVAATQHFRGESREGATFEVMCECPALDCLDMVELGADEFEAARRRPDMYVVTPGHVNPPLHGVAEEHDGYWIATGPKVVTDGHR